MEWYSELKKFDIKSCKAIKDPLDAFSVSERSQSQKASHSMTPTK